MKYVVLGSSGQIGEPLVNHIRSLGHEAVEIDIVRSADDDLRVVCETNSEDSWEDKIRQSDFVFFLAFDVGGSVYLSKYQHTFDFFHNNITLMRNVFDVLERYKKPFVFASSQMSNMSYSPYGLAKAVGEAYTKTLGGLVVKFWNVYGVEHDLSKSHVITDFIIKAKKTKVIDMMTDGREVRQFLHADDCCRALVKTSDFYDTLDREKEYHITSFEWNSINDVATIISEILGGDIKVVPGARSDTVQRDKRNEPDRHILTIWKPEISLREGIEKVISCEN